MSKNLQFSSETKSEHEKLISRSCIIQLISPRVQQIFSLAISISIIFKTFIFLSHNNFSFVSLHEDCAIEIIEEADDKFQILSIKSEEKVIDW